MILMFVDIHVSLFRNLPDEGYVILGQMVDFASHKIEDFR